MLISSCEKNLDNKIASCFQVDLNDTNDYALSDKWIFLGILNNESQIECCKPENLREMNIEFNDDSTLLGISSCNYIFGYYSTSDPDSIKIERLGSTKVYCINDTVREWEEKYCTGLENATNFNILGNRLKIITKTSLNLIFRAE